MSWVCKSCTHGETGTVESEFPTMTPTSVAAYLKRRRWNPSVMSLRMQDSLQRVTSSELGEGNRRTPTRTKRFIGANVGNSTGRESYEFGTPIVVRDGSAVHMAKGQPSKEGQSLPLIPGGRVGIVKFQ